LTGARLFTGSFESAIYLLGAICGVPGSVNVIPAINSNFTHHISAGLKDGTIITGQNAISHPSAPSTAPYATTAPTPIATNTGTPTGVNGAQTPYSLNPNTLSKTLSVSSDEHDKIEDANLPGSHPSLRISAISFTKERHANSLLPSPISRIWYINPYGQEIRPSPNPKVFSALQDASCLIYSIGSLYTSIIPCLVLRDVGEAIATSQVRYKILILNGSLDRETKPEGMEYGARDFIAAIADACASSRSKGPPPNSPEEEEAARAAQGDYKQYVTHGS
jgi:2-phospho-L-lactate transferase/gluconeogenesis factor (CofD/UPF0052 family)